MEFTDLTVKLANGSLVKALGLLRNFKIKVLNHYVYHIFVIMDFNDKPCSYKMILGRPFICEYNMVHDWSQNHVYLTLEDKTLRVDLKTGKVHSMARKFFKENVDTIIVSDSKPTTSINYCKNLQRDIDPRTQEYTNDEL